MSTTSSIALNHNPDIEALLSKRPAHPDTAVAQLRHLILTDGIPANSDGLSNLRPYIWCILLDVKPISTSTYLSYIHRGPSPAYSKIRNDTFRTLATDPLFRRRVSESSLIRLLNAFAWKLREKEMPVPYVQGMNVLAAPFLYAAKSETLSFALFETFILRECPLYVKPTLEGVHRGLKLLDECLQAVDSKLYSHLRSKNLAAELYAFPSVLTFSACTPPLPQVLALWDFLLAYGPHLNILCVVAQLLLMRDDLLAHSSPMKILRTFPPLKSKTVIGVAVSLVRKIPHDLYNLLARHAWDESVGDVIDNTR